MMKKTLTAAARPMHQPPKPRNPLVAAARFRRAGSHTPSGSSARQQASQMLRRELGQAMPGHSP